MPRGTVGFEAVGDIDDDDFEDVVAPVLRQQIASGHKLRLLYLLGPQLREYDGDAAQEEFKFAARHATAYERVGVVGRLRNPDRQDVVYPAARMPRSWKRVCMSMRIFS